MVMNLWVKLDCAAVSRCSDLTQGGLGRYHLLCDIVFGADDGRGSGLLDRTRSNRQLCSGSYQAHPLSMLPDIVVCRLRLEGGRVVSRAVY